MFLSFYFVMRFRFWLPLGLVLSLILQGCASGGYQVPVAERPQPKSHRPAHHTVERGDTMFSIAWRYGLDYRKLASANNIAAPYTIIPGQRLLLSERVVVKKASPKPPSQKALPSKTTVAKTTTAKPAATAASKTPPPPAPVPPTMTKWYWPVQGAVIARFSSSAHTVHKGIDFSGKDGDPVRSANHGVVVYAGNGLVGYGNLIIIKHSKSFFISNIQ